MSMNPEQVGAAIQQAAGDGLSLMVELKDNFEGLMNKTIFHGYWDTLPEMRGCIPEARKGATMNMIGSKIYIFGGLSRHTYNDMKIFDLEDKSWKQVDYKTVKVPEPRIHHAVVSYNKTLALFGGGGEYMERLKMRSSFNDIWIFDARSLTWSKREGSGIPPKKRM